MSTSVTEGTRPGELPAAAGGGSLFRAEVHRFTARRMVRVLVALALVAFALGVAIAMTQFAQPTEAALTEARAEMAAQLRMEEQFRQECLQDANRPEDVSPEEFCGPPPSEENLELAWFMDKSPFVLADQLPGGSIGVGGAAAALAFVLGATYIGAEWSTRSIVALLFWEPRRLRVIATKVAVTVLAALALAVVALALWYAAAYLLASTRGTTELPPGFWGDLLAQQGRVVVLIVLAALGGFALANLIRNTGAALGVMFVYFAVVETAVGILFARGQQFLISSNVGGLLVEGGLELFISGDVTFDEQGNVLEGTQVVISNLEGGLTLTAYVLALLLVGTWLFKRRDLH